MNKSTRKNLSIALGLALTLLAGAVSAGTISVVGSRSELDTIESEFTAFGDTVVRYNQSWGSLSAAQLDAIFSSDVVWEGDIFAAIPADVATRMQNFVNGNGGLMLTAERSCCETHNDGVEAVGRALTGDNGLLVGDLGYDVFGHSFSNSPTTILTAPNDIRGQDAQHSGPGRVEPTGGVNSDACFVVSTDTNNANGQVCTAAAWGPDALTGAQGRLVIYGDINSQPSLVNNFNGDQFENMRQFLLAGFTGGVDVCIQNPNLPGCPGGNDVPAPTPLALLGFGLMIPWLRRRI